MVYPTRSSDDEVSIEIDEYKASQRWLGGFLFPKQAKGKETCDFCLKEGIKGQIFA